MAALETSDRCGLPCQHGLPCHVQAHHPGRHLCEGEYNLALGIRSRPGPPAQTPINRKPGARWAHYALPAPGDMSGQHQSHQRLDDAGEPTGPTLPGPPPPEALEHAVDALAMAHKRMLRERAGTFDEATLDAVEAIQQALQALTELVRQEPHE